MLEDREAELAFVHVAVGEVELAEDHLQQGAARAELGAGERDDRHAGLELLGEHGQQQRFARADGADDQGGAFVAGDRRVQFAGGLPRWRAAA